MAKKAPNAPGSDAFHIHHVVVMFHINMVMYVNPKNVALLFTLVSRYNKGIHATKMSNVSGDTGHAAHNKIPPEIAKSQLMNGFKKIISIKITEVS